MKGAFCISLDFEKFWGIHDVKELNETENQLLKVDQIVKELLNLFSEYNIHCTWATVGLLNFESTQQLLDYNKEKYLPYTCERYNPFPLSKFKLETFNSKSYLAKKTIQNIQKYPNQEIASHTYSHFYCLESGITETDFRNDIRDFKTVMGFEPKSIVFPRNQINQQFLKIAKQKGFMAFRGNQPNLFWKNSAYKSETKAMKIGRFLDAYIKITKDNFIDWKTFKHQNGLVNIYGSRFFRPAKFNSMFEKMKVNRIKKQMTKAAKHNLIYHLWWHPHNFSTRSKENFDQLKSILNHYQMLQKKYNFNSLNMQEIANQIEA